MFKELKMKLAARRVERKNNAAAKKTNINQKRGFWATLWAVISWPFRMLVRLFAYLWSWIRSIDLIGLINMTLLIAIIVLFAMLIIDITNCKKKTVVFIASESNTVTTAQKQPETVSTNEVTIEIRKKKPEQVISLPLKKDLKKNCNTYTVNIAKSDKVKAKFYGDLIIDGEFPNEKLFCGAKVNGNLYLQNMRRYTLPCNTRVDGDLFLRNVSMLKFCGEFTVTGNIYVSRNSSFGPIPKTARLGGQVIF